MVVRQAEEGYQPDSLSLAMECEIDSEVGVTENGTDHSTDSFEQVVITGALDS